MGEGKEPQQERGKRQEQEPKKKPQESVIQEREQGQRQEQVQERPTQEEEQVSSPQRCWQQIPIKISGPLLNCGFLDLVSFLLYRATGQFVSQLSCSILNLSTKKQKN